jgi:type VI secretion system protein ImpK
MVEASPRLRPPIAGGLAELVEPLFLFVCRLNRIARSQDKVAGSHTNSPFASQSTSYEQTRAEVVRLLTVMKEESAADVALARQFEQIEMPLVFFVDSIIAESQLPFRDRWHENRLAGEREELAGDDKFFDMLDATLADASEEATERLVIYYTCLGLGFTGKYTGEPLQIDTRMQRVTHRIRRRWLNRDFEKRLSPQCYEHTDKSDLPKPSRDSVVKIVFIGAFVLISLIIAYTYFYNKSAGELRNLVEELSASPATPAKSP